MVSLSEKFKNLRESLNNNPDIVVRELEICNKQIALMYCKSTVDKMLFVQSIFVPLRRFDGEVTLDSLKKNALNAVEVEQIEEDFLTQNLAKNKVLVFVEGQSGALSVDLELLPARQPTEPPTSQTIQGPREGFTESVKMTTALIRKRFPTKDLVIKEHFIGDVTNTQINLYYLKGIASEKIVKKLEARLKKINIDGIIDSHYIMELLEERPNSLFDQFGIAEKPDIIAARMLEGRIAIAIDGSPIILTVPHMFFEDLQNSNDYYTNLHYATFLRYIRALGIILATVVPGTYLCLRLYHYRIVPLKYLVTVNSTTQNLPFTPFVEMIFILLLFQILYEVSLRLPKYLGLATSVVGALVLGDTAVQAGLVSPPGIIVIALSMIAVYTVPNQAPQLTVLRFVFLLIGGALRLLGVIGGMIYIINYLNTLNDFGAPYLAPYAPRVESDIKDGLHRYPLKNMTSRPKSYPVSKISRIKGEE